MPDFTDTESADQYLNDLLKEPTAYEFTPRSIDQDWTSDGQFETWHIQGDLGLRGKQYKVAFYQESGEHGETNVEIEHGGQPVIGYDAETEAYRDTWEQRVGLDDVVLDICNRLLAEIYDYRREAQQSKIDFLCDTPHTDKVELDPS